MTAARRPTWYLLVLTLPSRPLYLRAKVRRLLAESGAAPVRKAVYALPASPAALERLNAIAGEVEDGGGSAFVCEAAFPDRSVEQAIDRACRRQHETDLRRWMADASRALRAAPSRPGKSRGGRSPESTAPAPRRVLAPLQRRLELLAAMASPGDSIPPQATALLARLEGRGTRSRAAGAGLAGRVWVTRRGLHVDRLACAWLVRRFIDPEARFRFTADPAAPRLAHEIGFDMPGAEISHEAEGCSAETLVRRAGITDPAARRIAEIVHDIDLKDGHFAHAETAGFERLLLGVLAVAPRDEERLERGLSLFDTLHAALRGGPRLPAAGSVPGRVPRLASPVPRRRP